MRREVVVLVGVAALVTLIMMGCGGDGGGREGATPNYTEAELAPIETAAAGQARVIIGFKQPPGQAERQMVEGHGGNVGHVYTLIPAMAATIPEQAIEGIRHNPNVAYIEGDPQMHACQDELGWGADRMNAERAWGHEEDAADIAVSGTVPVFAGCGFVSLLDTGIDYTHPDLAANYRGDFGCDFVNDDADPMDDNGHGTHCAGVVAAADNELGMINVAPGATLVAYKVLDANGVGYTSDVIAALEREPEVTGQILNAFRVICMSFTGKSSSSLRKACDASWNSGCGALLVAAAGDSVDGVGYPAQYDSVVAVSAVDSSDLIAGFSATGDEVELAAPGVDIKSTWIGGGYQTMSGTSVACAHICGLANIENELAIWSSWWAGSGVSTARVEEPTGGAASIRGMLISDAADIGAPGRDDEYGYGLPTFGYRPPGQYIWDVSWAVEGKNLIVTITAIEDSDGDSIPEETDALAVGADVHLYLHLDTGVSWVFDGVTDSTGQVHFVLRKAESGTYLAEARVGEGPITASTFTVP